MSREINLSVLARINYDEVGKENRRNDKLKAESELAINKIKGVVSDLKKMREEIDSLKEDMERRQSKILSSIRGTIRSQIAELLPEDTERKIVYDDDDMVTALACE